MCGKTLQEFNKWNDLLKKRTQFTDIECVVCLEKLSLGDVLQPCGHKIHIECIILSGKKECPLCRGKISNLRQFDIKQIQYRKQYLDN